jgi:transcriptional regulator with PAS, ATPase and Fis domain
MNSDYFYVSGATEPDCASFLLGFGSLNVVPMAESTDIGPLADQLLRKAVDSMADGLFIVSPNRKILYFSERAEKLTGLKAQDVLGQECAKVLRGGHCDRVDCLLSAEPSEPRTMELLFPDDRRLRVEQRSHTLLSGDGRPLAGVVSFAPCMEGEPRLPPTPAIEATEAGARIIGRSAAIRKVVDTIRRVAPGEATVLITGESGTGKELVAHALHQGSRRAHKAFIPVNSAAIPNDLLESEIFGHVRGAFTGAMRDRRGLVAMAEGGTLFLDEIGDLAMPLQAKLLRLLQERTYQRVGDSSVVKANLRIVAATNVDLQQAVAMGRFRQDLYFRLAVIPLRLPPLRERREDIAPLAAHLLTRRALQAGRKPMHFSPEAMRVLEGAHWEGNVRQLLNVIDYVIALSESDTVDARALPDELSPVVARGPALAFRARYQTPTDPASEAAAIQRALENNGFHRQRTAAALGMDRVTLYRKMREYGIAIPDTD